MREAKQRTVLARRRPGVRGAGAGAGRPRQRPRPTCTTLVADRRRRTTRTASGRWCWAQKLLQLTPARGPRHLPGLRARGPLAGRPRQPPPGRLRRRGVARLRPAATTAPPRDLDDEKLLVTHRAAAPLRRGAAATRSYDPRRPPSRWSARSRPPRSGFVRGGEVAVAGRPARRTRLEVVGGWGDATVDAARGAVARRAHRRVLHGGADAGCADVLRDLPGGAAACAVHRAMTRRVRGLGAAAPAARRPGARRQPAHPLTRGDGRLVARRRRGRRRGPLRLLASTAATPGPTRAGVAAARRPARPVGASFDPTGVRLDRRRLARRRARRRGDLRDCTSARSPPRARSTRPSTGCDHLVDLGVDVVELLPLASFPGVSTAGATTASRRTRCTSRTAARRRCSGSSTPRTRHGLAVCLDVVYNHLGPGRELPRRVRAVLHRPLRRPRGARRSTSTARDSDEVRRWVLDNVQQWLRDFHVDGLRLDAVHELHDDTRRCRCWRRCRREVDALAAAIGRPLWLIAESDRNDPGTVTPRGAGDAVAGLGLHAPVGRRRPPRAARGADRRDPGLLRRLRRRPARWPRCSRTPFFHDGTCSTFRGRRHGRPVDAGDRPGLAVRRRRCRPTTRSATGRRATGSPARCSTRPRRAGLRGGAAADLAVHADAVHGRGVGRPHAVAVLHRPHRPRASRRPPQDGRKRGVRLARLGRATTCPTRRTRRRSRARGWTGPSRTREPHARLLRLVPRPDRAAPGPARPARRRAWTASTSPGPTGGCGRAAAAACVLVNLADEPWTCDGRRRGCCWAGSRASWWTPGGSTYPRGARSSWDDRRPDKGRHEG